MREKKNHAYLFVDIVVITKKHDARIPDFKSKGIIDFYPQK